MPHSGSPLVAPVSIAASLGVLFIASLASAQDTPREPTWRFDRLDQIGGHPTQIVGHPRIIDTAYGKAVQFNGVDDGFFIDQHPLAGASTYTWEVIFRPDADGPEAQRFFDLQEQDPATGQDTNNRMLFEIRILDGRWCLDSFASSGPEERTWLNSKLLHPLGRWYRVTAVYDGKTLRNDVDDQLQGEAAFDLKPHRPGHTSIGMRINKICWFQGAVLMARMIGRALRPDEFLKMPPRVDSSSAKSLPCPLTA
jgi:Concanavalin A-like lectin/glucanases superfamily